MVVGCSIVETKLSSSVKCSHYDAEQKTIHLHLKKFFSGTRFSSQYFLNCMSAKHKEGDLVYVSGKVGELKYCYLLHATYSHFLVVLPNHEACLQMVFLVFICFLYCLVMLRCKMICNCKNSFVLCPSAFLSIARM